MIGIVLFNCPVDGFDKDPEGVVDELNPVFRGVTLYEMFLQGCFYGSLLSLQDQITESLFTTGE